MLMNRLVGDNECELKKNRNHITTELGSLKFGSKVIWNYIFFMRIYKDLI